MADAPIGGGKAGRIESLIKAETVITICAIIGAGLVGWGATQSNISALAQRVEKGEARDDETARTLNTLNGSIIELRTDAKAVRTEQDRQGRQLDRIERLLRGAPAAPTAPRAVP